MGAVIGGLHASGYSGEQLDSIFNVTDFNKIINDNIPRKYKTYHKKEMMRNILYRYLLISSN